MKIVVMDRSSVGDDTCVDGFYRFGEVEQHYSTPNELVAERVKDADIIVNNKNLLNEASLKDAKNVKLVCQLATGYDNVDVEYCRQRGIKVANVRNYSTAAVVQHTIALVWEISDAG